MSELKRLLAAYDKQKALNCACALATVVRAEGSSYRRPGARMLANDNGQLTGTISGGCLEGDARRRAQQAMQRGKPEIVVYDSTDVDEDLEFGAQLGCQGKVHILLEPLDFANLNNPLELLRETALQEEPVLLATVLASSDTDSAQVGSRLLLKANGTAKGALTTKAGLHQNILTDLQALLRDEQSAHLDYEKDGINLKIYAELIQPAPQLTVYGAGNDVQPLVEMTANLGWRVTVIDGRANLTLPHRFPEAEQVITLRVDELNPFMQQKGFAVLMSHNYHYDYGVLKQLSRIPQVQYIGLLGPRKKADLILTNLKEEGIETASLTERLFAPVGLNIGAEAANEIAIAVMAELLAVYHGHAGGFLRDLNGPIHNRSMLYPQSQYDV